MSGIAVAAIVVGSLAAYGFIGSMVYGMVNERLVIPFLILWLIDWRDEPRIPKAKVHK